MLETHPSLGMYRLRFKKKYSYEPVFASSSSIITSGNVFRVGETKKRRPRRAIIFRIIAEDEMDRSNVLKDDPTRP
jgi:hypothetical protein